jgi:hypothetical protein
VIGKARCSQTSMPATHRADAHSVETYIDLDSIIDIAVIHSEIYSTNDDGPTGTIKGNTDLLAYMAGQQSSSGDIRQVLAAKGALEKQKQ